MSKISFAGVETSFDAIAIYSSNGPVSAAHEMVQSSSRNILEIHIPSTAEYNDIMSVYTNENALSEITVTNDATDEAYVYLNYVIPVSLSLTRYNSTEEINAFGPDRWIMRIAQLTEADKQFRQLVGVAAKSVAYLTVDEYKDVKIQYSKEQLESYLKKNPLISNCKDNVYKEYTVTTDKQNQFAAQFAVYLANKMAGVEDVFTWNEMGQPCVPWDEPSCIKWMNAAKAYTKPLVQAQQAYEVEVMKMTSKADIEKFDIDYSKVDTVNGKREWIGHTDSEATAIDQQNENISNGIISI